jgi:hypothetical protein
LGTGSIAAEFAVSDLVRGWDDVRRLLTTTDPDEVWEAVSSWPSRRLATALVAAVTVAGPDDASAVSWPDTAAVAVAGDVSGGCGRGHVSGQQAAAERPS